MGMDERELRRRRLTLGLNQSQLARTLGVSVQTIFRWEKGELGIRHPVILALALDALERERERERASGEGERDGA